MERIFFIIICINRTKINLWTGLRLLEPFCFIDTSFGVTGLSVVGSSKTISFSSDLLIIVKKYSFRAKRNHQSNFSIPIGVPNKYLKKNKQLFGTFYTENVFHFEKYIFIKAIIRCKKKKGGK